MKNTAKIDTKLESMVNFISENEAKALFGVAFASAMGNPTVTWAKFTLTDDAVNGNGQRIPDSEFQNLISTGINMPIKMAEGEINPGHEESKPLGVMTNLKEVVNELGNKAIVALAALWSEERPADVAYLKERYANNQPIDISWEILYEDAAFNQEKGSVDLLGTVLRAATVVGNPAYQGRTQFLSVAAKKWSKAYVEQLPNECFLYVDADNKKYFPVMDAEGMLDRAKLEEALNGLGELDLPTPVLKQKKAEVRSLIDRFKAGASLKDVSKSFYAMPENTEEPTLDAIETLKAQVAELETKLADALASVQSKEQAFAEKETTVSDLQKEVARLGEELTAKEAELAPLREFKANLDAEKAKEEALATLKTKFTEAGVEKSDEFFKENAETLLKLDEASLNLMIAEAAKAVGDKTSSAALDKKTKIPVLPTEETADYSDPKVLGAALKNSKAKK